MSFGTFLALIRIKVTLAVSKCYLCYNIGYMVLNTVTRSTLLKFAVS